MDVDIYHPQVLRIARMKGAQIVIASQFIDSYQLSRHMLTTGIWERRSVKRRLCCGLAATVFLRSLLPAVLTQDESAIWSRRQALIRCLQSYTSIS